MGDRVTIALSTNEHGVVEATISTDLDTGGSITLCPAPVWATKAVNACMAEIAWAERPHDCLEGAACKFPGCTIAASKA